MSRAAGANNEPPSLRQVRPELPDRLEARGELLPELSRSHARARITGAGEIGSRPGVIRITPGREPQPLRWRDVGAIVALDLR